MRALADPEPGDVFGVRLRMPGARPRWLVEMLGFVLLPSLLYAYGARNRSVKTVRVAAVLTILGIVLNRLNVSIIAWDYANVHHYAPRWTEFAVSASLVTMGVLAFRWIVNRMPILHEAPGAGPEPAVASGTRA